MIRARQTFRACLTVAAIAAGVAPIAALAEEGRGRGAALASEPPPAYLTSPFHRMSDGDGRVIPCRCRFQGREFRLGEQVCMSTHLGTVLTRCDLMLNNTSWVPTDTACSISQGPSTGAGGIDVAAAFSRATRP